MRFRPGHGTRRDAREGRPHRTPYVPTPDEIPSGVCECGCGERTALALFTDRKRRWFRGFPTPFIRGHNTTTGKGDQAPRWNGGRTRHKSGYIYVYSPGHPAVEGRRDPYVAEHRLVMEKKLGRFLSPGEEVHHRNGVKDDNRLRNLELWVVSQPRGQRVEDIVVWAKSILRRYDPDSLR